MQIKKLYLIKHLNKRNQVSDDCHVKIFTYVDWCIYCSNIKNKDYKYSTQKSARLAALQKPYGQPAYFCKKNTFLYDFAVGCWLANCSIWAIQMPHHKPSSSSATHLVVQMTITWYSKVANANNLYMYRRKEIASYGYNFNLLDNC